MGYDPAPADESGMTCGGSYLVPAASGSGSPLPTRDGEAPACRAAIVTKTVKQLAACPARWKWGKT